jgi:hypothetical protein
MTAPDRLHAWAGSLRETTRIIGLSLGCYGPFAGTPPPAPRSGSTHLP